MSTSDLDLGAGLSSAEVDARVAAGQVNHQAAQTSRSYVDIVRSNVFTRFNLIITVLAGIVLAVGELADALFAGVMVVNAVIGIVQEVRAKRTLDRLRLLVAPVVTVLRDGVEVAIDPAAVVLDDVVVLRSGDQVPVDGRVVGDGSIEVDESALTGESDAVAKAEGDEVLSGSAVVAGSASIVACRVGADTWIHRLVVQAKEYVPATSELRSGVDRILRYVGWGVGPLAALLFWSQIRSNESTSDGLISAVAGVVGLVPQGLVLLVSMALAVAIVRLARAHVVVQELHAVEGLARVDVFCVDKTGTLTTGVMAVDTFVPVGPASASDRDLGDLDPVRTGLAALVAAESSPTATLSVIGEFVGHRPPLAVSSHVPFSSARKWSGITVEAPATCSDRSWLLGAPEILLDHVEPIDRARVAAAVTGFAVQAQRVVLVASSDAALAGPDLPARVTARALVVLSEQVRPDAAATLDYFARQGVAVKVISGDNPATVSAVAARVGLADGGSVDMREIDVDDPTFAELVARTNVFGRVLPDQKRAIVDELQRAGHRVAMTGDGVNDIPALKRADIGIAMDTATPATKAISQVILLDGRFDRMPDVVAEGRRVIANMERVSALFVTKTVYAALFALAIGFSGSIFPFLPRQMSLVSELTIGVPAFALSFRSAHAPCRPGYLTRVMRFAAPAGSGAAVVTLLAYWVARSPLGGADLDQARSVSTIALIVWSLWVLVELMSPVDRLDLTLLATLIALLVTFLAVPPVRDFYRLEAPPTSAMISTALIVVGSIVASEVAVRRWRGRQLMSEAARQAGALEKRRRRHRPAA